MDKRKGITLVEVVIASTIFVLFLGGGFALYLQGQGTISKSTWINNSTREEGFAVKELAELSKLSAYPTTVFSGVLKVNNNDRYKARCPSGINEIILSGDFKDILAFPVCEVQMANKDGSIKWVILRLQKSKSYNNYYDLDIIETSTIAFGNPSAPGYVMNFSGSGYSNSLNAEKRKTIVHDIESAIITKEAKDAVKIELILSYPKSSQFKKKITIKFPLNIEIL